MYIIILWSVFICVLNTFGSGFLHFLMGQNVFISSQEGNWHENGVLVWQTKNLWVIHSPDWQWSLQVDSAAQRAKSVELSLSLAQVQPVAEQLPSWRPREWQVRWQWGTPKSHARFSRSLKLSRVSSSSEHLLNILWLPNYYLLMWLWISEFFSLFIISMFYLLVIWYLKPLL